MIAINWQITPMTAENIELIDSTLGIVGDWLRFSGSSWIIISEKTEIEIFAALGGVLKQGDQEIIARIDPSHISGWAPKWIDDWISARRSAV